MTQIVNVSRSTDTIKGNSRTDLWLPILLVLLIGSKDDEEEEEDDDDIMRKEDTAVHLF
jgi:hypothetical protein